MTNKRGFTLIELMIVVAIIGILAAVATGKFGELVARSKEARVKSHLGTLRSTLAVYYSDNEIYPADPNTALVNGAKYLLAIPQAEIPAVTIQSNPGHSAGNVVGFVLDDNATGSWYYDLANSQEGQMYVNCTHRDTRGAVWSVE